MYSYTKYTECQTNDSRIEYKCKISRQENAVTDTLNTHARSTVLSSYKYTYSVVDTTVNS